MENLTSSFLDELDEYYLRGDAEEAEQFMLRSAADPHASPRDLIAIYNELGGFYRGVGRYRESISAFGKARELAADVVGEDNEEYATILNNMAGTCRLMRDYWKAIEYFEQAARIYQKTGGDHTYPYASVLNNLALAYRETQQQEKAIKYLKQAMALLEEMTGHEQEIAITCNNLAELYYAAGDRKEAMYCLNQALQAYQKCPEEERLHYAAVLNSLAGIQYAEGNYWQAVELYRQSAVYTRRFFGESVEYGITCQNMRWAYERLGDLKSAIESLEKAAAVFRRNLGEDHERTQAVLDELQRLERMVQK